MLKYRIRGGEGKLLWALLQQCLKLPPIFLDKEYILIEWPSRRKKFGFEIWFPHTAWQKSCCMSFAMASYFPWIHGKTHVSNALPYPWLFPCLNLNEFFLWSHNNLHLTAPYTEWFFNCSSQFSVPKWKTMGSKSEILFHRIFHVQKIPVGWTMFFFLALKRLKRNS